MHGSSPDGDSGRSGTLPFDARNGPSECWLRVKRPDSTAIPLPVNSTITIGSRRVERTTSKKAPDLSVGDDIQHISSEHAHIARGNDGLAIVYQTIAGPYFYTRLLTGGEEEPILVGNKSNAKDILPGDTLILGCTDSNTGKDCGRYEVMVQDSEFAAEEGVSATQPSAADVEEVPATQHCSSPGEQTPIRSGRSWRQTAKYRFGQSRRPTKIHACSCRCLTVTRSIEGSL